MKRTGMMESMFKEELEMIHLMEDWEEAYVRNLTRKGIVFKEKIQEMKIVLSERLAQ